MKTRYFTLAYKSGLYLPERYGRIFFFQRKKPRNHPVNPVEFIPTGKGNSVFLAAEQGRAASGFWKNHPRYAAVFSQKTLHSLNTDLWLPVE